MAVEHGYVSLGVFKEELGDTGYASDVPYERAISAASRWIDRYCQRHFWLSTPTPKRLRATSRAVLRTGDFATTAGMSVEVDLAGDGLWSPFDAQLWQAEPFAPDAGCPFERISPTTGTSWPVDARRPRVKVTAAWGWPTIPSEVEQACVILGIAFLLGKEVVSNQDGYSLTSPGPTDPISLAQSLLEPFTPESVMDQMADRMSRRR